MKFNSQICTSIEQSQRLLDLGLKKETADCMYSVMTKSYNGDYILEEDRRYNITLYRQEGIPTVGFGQYEYIPAWSLHRLIEICSESYYTFNINVHKMDLYDFIINTFEHLKKQGKINKEYLK